MTGCLTIPATWFLKTTLPTLLKQKCLWPWRISEVLMLGTWTVCSMLIHCTTLQLFSRNLYLSESEASHRIFYLYFTLKVTENYFLAWHQWCLIFIYSAYLFLKKRNHLFLGPGTWMGSNPLDVTWRRLSPHFYRSKPFHLFSFCIHLVSKIGFIMLSPTNLIHDNYSSHKHFFYCAWCLTSNVSHLLHLKKLISVLFWIKTCAFCVTDFFSSSLINQAICKELLSWL